MASPRPNVVLVVIDDMGFGASSAYGGPCEMPTADRLAREGLRYSRFHVTALCSPTRQALLTGRNHHSVGMGGTTEMATAAPFHVAPQWRDRYRGRFDQGWDRQRELTLDRQQAMGIVPPEARLAPWVEGVPHWDELDATQRAVAVRFMETYAGFAEHTDAQVGRLIEALEDAGVLDDTLFVYLLGDNGASGEGGLEGTLREHLVGHGFSDDTAHMATRLEQFGDGTTYGLYPVGWALAMNTPYQWTKQVASHYGGTRDGMILRWGDRVPDPGGVRHQWHHVIDVLPTVLEVAGIREPEQVAGVRQQPMEGTSFAYSIEEPGAGERHTTQYFEMCGNRGVYHDGWTAVTRHGTPWVMVPEGLPAFEDDVWELYDTTTDWTQSDDLATREPDRLRMLQDLFTAEATRYHVFPLDDRVTGWENPEVAGRPSLLAGRTSITYAAGMGRFTEEATLNTKNRSHTITASVTVGAGACDGVIIAQGGRFGGWSLYVRDGLPAYAYNCYGRDLVTVRSTKPLTPRRHELHMDFDADEGRPGSGVAVRLHVDGEPVGECRLERTTAYYFSFDETLNVGVDRGTPVTDDYAALDNAFQGTIEWVRIDLRASPPNSTRPNST